MPRFRQSSAIRWIAITVTVLVALLGVSFSPAFAGPITNSSPTGQAPFTKLGLYQKALQIVDSSGAFLRFGQNGTDISASGDIIFRPSGNGSIVTSANGVKVTANGTTTSDIYIPGDLCLYNHSAGNPADCRHQLAAGAGASLWQDGTFTNAWYGTTVHYIEPIPVAGSLPGVQLGTTTSRLTTTAATIGGGVIAKNLGSGLAADFEGSLAAGDATVPLGDSARIFLSGTVKIGGHEPWYPEMWSGQKNEGAGSGLDADRANGNQVTIEGPASCSDTVGAGPQNSTPGHVACLCFLINFTKDYSDGSTYYNAQEVPPVKRCIDLANRY